MQAHVLDDYGLHFIMAALWSIFALWFLSSSSSSFFLA